MNMKKIIVMVLLLLPLGMVAQELKIAVVKANDILAQMPEVIAMQAEMEKQQQIYQKEMKSFDDDYTRKYQDFMNQQDSLPENISKIRMQELQQMQMRMENFQQFATQELEKRQTELYAPIQEKLQKAIDQVGEENGYTLMLVYNPNIILFMGKSAIDATDKVKAKLGLK